MDANDLGRHQEKNVSLHGTSPWHPDHSAAHISYKRELPPRKAVASMVNFASASLACRPLAKRSILIGTLNESGLVSVM